MKDLYFILFIIKVNNLIPYTKYEFRLKAFINTTPTSYSNSIFIQTLETIPDKIENLHGYIWNKTSVFIHWTPPNSTNGPNFVRKTFNTVIHYRHTIYFSITFSTIQQIHLYHLMNGLRLLFI